MTYRVAVDTGGTFTDVMMFNTQSGEIETVKVPSTPQNPDQAVVDGVTALSVSPAALAFLGHGTTVAINTLVQRQGVKTGLITTPGFRDVLEIQRTNRPDMYNLFYRKPIPLVPRNLRLEVTERILADGAVQTPLDLDALHAAVETLISRNIDALAICFLNSYINPAHEEAAAAYVRQHFPDLAVSVSVEIAKEWREYERTSTAALNAYLTPSVRSYLSRLDAEMGDAGYRGHVLITRSDGGLTLSRSAAEQPATMLMSGPAGGVLGAAEYGRVTGFPNLITFDIGGTTCDVSLIEDGEPLRVRDRLVEGYPVLAPFIDIYSIGAGGGTIAWADSAGMLRVGPQSAGAQPGPACYDRGGDQPTVTDAYLLLGMIDPDAFLGGQMPLNRERAEAVFAKLATDVEMDLHTCAHGALTILDHAMTAALRVVSVGAATIRGLRADGLRRRGALHLGSLARELGIRRGIVPRYPSLFSAWGILAANLRHAYTQTVNQRSDEVGAAQLAQIVADLRAQGAAQLADDGVGADATSFAVSMDMRYQGQEHNVNVAASTTFTDESLSALIDAFHAAHRQLYTYELRGEPVVITNVRADAIGVQPTPQIREWTVTGSADDARKGERPVLLELDEGFQPTPIYDRERLAAGVTLGGPCIVEEATSTTVIRRGQTLTVDRWGNLVMGIGD
ncbi:MAG: hydantoinase/oxoprolinase family protein [Caldilineaceae bacterium]